MEAACSTACTDPMLAQKAEFGKRSNWVQILTMERLRSGEHTRPRVWQSAPSPTASAHPIGSKEDARKWSAGAPTTAREGACAPQTADVPSFGAGCASGASGWSCLTFRIRMRAAPNLTFQRRFLLD